MSDSIQQIQGYEVLEDGKPFVWRNNSGEPEIGETYFYRDWDHALEHCKDHLNVWADYLPEDWQPNCPITIEEMILHTIKSLKECELV